MTKTLFATGRIVMTPGAAEATGRREILQYLMRHAGGDWGVVNDEDRQENDRAVKDGSRILSAYPIDPAEPCEGWGDNTLWIITEADRSVTTVLLPDEY